MRPKSGEFYKHFKNKLYQIVTVATHSETGEELVIYQALYGDYKVYARPLEMFTSEVDHEKYPDVQQKYRFEKVDWDNKKEVAESGEDKEQAHKVVESEAVNATITVQADDKADERLLNFLDADTFAQKLDLLTLYQKNMDNKLIDAIAASLDTIVPEGDIEERYTSLRSFVATQAKYECNRFR